MKKNRLFLLSFIFALGTILTAAQIIPTTLKITIRNDLGNLESGVTVTLYKTQEDFQAEENQVMSAQTNTKGVVTFKGLEAKSYFVSAVKGDMDNYGAGVQTTLDAKKINKVTIIIE